MLVSSCAESNEVLERQVQTRPIGGRKNRNTGPICPGGNIYNYRHPPKMANKTIYQYICTD